MKRLLKGQRPLEPPTESVIGALLNYISSADPASFQPMKANFGILSQLPHKVKDKTLRKKLLAERALEFMSKYVKL